MTNQIKVTPLLLDDGTTAYTVSEPESFSRFGVYRPAFVEFYLDREATQYWGVVFARKLDAGFDKRAMAPCAANEFEDCLNKVPLTQKEWWLGSLERQATHPRGVKLSTALGAWLRSKPAILGDAKKLYLSTNSEYFTTAKVRSKLKDLLAKAIGAHLIPGSDSVLELELDAVQLALP